jgi:hypothetical protein
LVIKSRAYCVTGPSNPTSECAVFAACTAGRLAAATGDAATRHVALYAHGRCEAAHIFAIARNSTAAEHPLKST